MKKEDIKKGLSDKQAKENLAKYGYNELRENIFTSPFKIFLRQIKNNFVIYLLFVAMVLSFLVGKSITAYVILAVIFIVLATGFIQEYRAEKVIASLKTMIVPVSIAIRNGKECEVLTRDLVPDDIILIRTGEKIPADCIVIEQKDLLVNESILTGESREISKKVWNNGDYKDENILYMGSFVVNGKCMAQIIHT